MTQLVCPKCGARNRVPAERLGDEPVCGRCGTELMAGHPAALDEGSLPAYLEGTELPVVVDYWASWCGPCRAMAPEFAAAAQRMPRVRFAKVDTEAAPQAAARAAVRSIPLLVLYQGGREVARRVGAAGARDIEAWITGQLAARRA